MQSHAKFPTATASALTFNTNDIEVPLLATSSRELQCISELCSIHKRPCLKEKNCLSVTSKQIFFVCVEFCILEVLARNHRLGDADLLSLRFR